MKNNLIFGTAKMGIKGYSTASNNLVENNSEILNFLNKKDILKLDTAERYGESHKIIGQYNRSSNNPFNVSTKIDNLQINDKNVINRLIEFTKKSIETLNINKLDVLYLHQSDMKIISDPYILDGLMELKSKNLVRSIGISIYDETELEFGIESELFDCIQLPINLYDSYLYDKYVSKYKGDKIKFIGRSIFFRGYLFKNHSLPFEKFTDFSLYSKINELIKSLDTDLSYLTMSFLKEKVKLNSTIFSSSSTHNINNIISLNNTKKFEIPEKLLNLSSKYKTWGDLRKVKNI